MSPISPVTTGSTLLPSSPTPHAHYGAVHAVHSTPHRVDAGLLISCHVMMHEFRTVTLQLRILMSTHRKLWKARHNTILQCALQLLLCTKNTGAEILLLARPLTLRDTAQKTVAQKLHMTAGPASLAIAGWHCTLCVVAPGQRRHHFDNGAAARSTL